MVGAKFGGLTNSYMSPEERDNLDPNSREHYNRVWGSRIQVIGWSLYACILWCLKICVATLYGRLMLVRWPLVFEDTWTNSISAVPAWLTSSFVYALHI